MPHICFVSSCFGRNDSLIVYRQGRSLAMKGFKITYILCDGLPDEEKFGIHIHSVGIKQKKLTDRIRKNYNNLKAYLKSFDADIYQISEPELLPLGLYLKRRGKMVMFNLREYYPDYYSRKNTIPQWAKKFAYRTIECFFRYCMKRYDALFNCLPELSDYIKKRMPCRYFVDVANFPLVNHDFKLTLEDYLKRDEIINYFGSIYSISCQEEMLQAITEFPNVKYLLAGVFYGDSYKQKVMSLAGWSQVEFINGFDRKELSSIINRSVIGNVLRDFKKTESPDGSLSVIKIYETMEAAVPIIIPRVRIYEEMVNKWHCGLCVDPHNVEEIKNAIRYLLENKEEAWKMGQNGRKAVIEEYSWDSQFKSYLEVVVKLLGEDK